jgi:hypothetical protein
MKLYMSCRSLATHTMLSFYVASAMRHVFRMEMYKSVTGTKRMRLATPTSLDGWIMGQWSSRWVAGAAALLGMIVACTMVLREWWSGGAWAHMCFIGAAAMNFGSVCALVVLDWQRWRSRLLPRAYVSDCYKQVRGKTT